LAFVSGKFRKIPEESPTVPEKDRLPLPCLTKPEPLPEPTHTEPRLSPLVAGQPSADCDVSLMSRVLCEKVGVFDVKEQRGMHLCFDSFRRHSGKDMGEAVEHMAGRWQQYQARAPGLEWVYGSAHKFFMSGKWDKPETWPEKRNGTSIRKGKY